MRVARSQSRWFLLSLGLVVLVGGGLRAWGTGFGLPFLYHGDEAEIVNRALAIPSRGPNPHWFVYPSLYFYVQSAAYVGLYAVQRLSGAVADYTQFMQATALDPTTVYRVGRLVTAALGTATIAFTGLAGRWFRLPSERDGRWAGLSAAVLLCFNLLHVEHSHYITTDVPAAFVASLLCLQVGAIAVSANGGSRMQYAVAGALVGLAASIKYPAALLAILVVLAYAQYVPRAGWRSVVRDVRLPLFGATAIGAFVLGSPFVVLDAPTFLSHFAVEMGHMRSGHLGFETTRNGWAALAGSVYNAGGLSLLVFFAIGALRSFRTGDHFGRALVVAALALFLVAGSSNVLFTRYLLPILPAACLVAGYGLVYAGSLLGRQSERARTAWVAALLLLSIVLPGYLVYHRLRLLAAADTRTLAWRWANDGLGSDGASTLVAVERNSIPVSQFPLAHAKTTPLVYDFGGLGASGVRYVAVTDRMYRRFLKAPERYRAQLSFYRDLLARGTLVRTFTPFSDDAGRLVAGPGGAPTVARGASGPLWTSLPKRRLAGPVVEVYEVPDAIRPPSVSAPSGAEDQADEGDSSDDDIE